MPAALRSHSFPLAHPVDPANVCMIGSRSVDPAERAALRYVRDNTVGTAFFDNLDLLADPDEPRDLFGMLLRRMSNHS